MLTNGSTAIEGRSGSGSAGASGAKAASGGAEAISAMKR